MNLWSRSADALVSLLYPPHCALCARATAGGEHLCAQCAALAPRIEPPFCQQCSQPFAGAASSRFICQRCLERRFPFQCAVARYRFRGVVRDLVHRFKYQRQFHLRHPLARWLAETLTDDRIARQPFDYLVPVPLHPARLREREFNQAAALCEVLAQGSGIRVRAVLRRIRYTTTQTRLLREQRMENLRNAFELSQTPRVSGCHLILVDDVFTTGSTVAECARLLQQAGAASIRVITVARG